MPWPLSCKDAHAEKKNRRRYRTYTQHTLLRILGKMDSNADKDKMDREGKMKDTQADTQHVMLMCEGEIVLATCYNSLVDTDTETSRELIRRGKSAHIRANKSGLMCQSRKHVPSGGCYV